jgi:cell division initiation protein
MFERPNPQQPPATPASTAAAQAGSVPAERVMRIAPLDLRQPRFKTSVRGFDKTEVVAFLTEAADDYEHALREIDRLRQDLLRMESLLAEHRERENNLRNTLLTAQRLSDEVKNAAQNEAKMIVREAQGRADLLLQKAQARLEEIEHDINELRLRRRGVEGSLEASIQALYHALEFMRDQDKPEEKVLLHRPRPAEAPAPPQRPQADVPRTADERG